MDDHPTAPAAPPPRVQAVRPSHGGYPDSGHPTVDDRLGRYLRDTHSIVRVAEVSAEEYAPGSVFAAIAALGTPSASYGATPLDAIDRMLTEAGR